MYPYYAIIENGKVIEYPANPETYQTGLEWDWKGGVLGCKEFVFCHNFEPECHPTKNTVENHRPVLNTETGYWYRGYDIVDASPAEISERLSIYRHAAERSKTAKVEEAHQVLESLAPIPPETQRQWDEYFVALDAIQKQTDFPWNVVWPTRPDHVKRIKATVERI